VRTSAVAALMVFGCCPTPHPTTNAEQRWLATRAARCIEWNESSDGEYSRNLWQFEGTTWRATTGLPGTADEYSAKIQNAAAYKLWETSGWLPWSTRYICGLD
jgi:hypothetical protein